MKSVCFVFGSLLVVLLAVSMVRAQDDVRLISTGASNAAMRTIRLDPAISRSINEIARDAIRRFEDKGLTSDDLSIAVIVDGEKPVLGGYNLNNPFYPASVVKVIYAVALQRAFADDEIERTPEVLNDLDRMLRVSSNSATNRILDILTDTQSGPELDPEELAEFARKRNAVNEYMQSLGFTGFNACQKTWDNAPYGRDTQFLGENYENRNHMNAADTARLVWLIKNEKVVSVPACREILKYMQRRPNSPRDIQARRIGGGIPETSRLWSKAGWTSRTNHDAAYVELPMGDPFVLVIYTNTSYQHGEIQQWIAQRVTSAIQLNLLRPQFTGTDIRRIKMSGSKGR